MKLLERCQFIAETSRKRSHCLTEKSFTIGISTEAGDLWSKDQTGIKVRERLDCQIVDDMAVYKAEIPADQISEPTKNTEDQNWKQ